MHSIWLTDLTHTGQSIASDAVPSAIGMIAEALDSKCPELDEIRLFKYPNELSESFTKNHPRILGLSNYIWNFSLSCQIARVVKKTFPDTITIMGGPNFPTLDYEQKEFLSSIPWIDFYIVKEAELALTKLVSCLIKSSYDAQSVDFNDIPNLVTLRGGRLEVSSKTERINNLNDIPSPYLSGRLDLFLDGKLMPVIQTNRGCPFTCAFCTEGQGFWNKVRKKTNESIGDEIRYIADRFSQLPKAQQRGDLLIADSNFGMFPDDLETCDVINEVQQTHGYPSYINVATGKNNKERVLEAARRVNGAMKLAGSVQSLDPIVQENMKRSNISADQIVSLALQASDIGANTYSEVILCLPGDTKNKHYETLRALVEADFSTISMYQLMCLPGTEFGEAETITKYGMKLRYRVLPRAFGTYEILGEQLNIAEIEQICISNQTLPYDDYLQCRRLNLMINIFFNERIFYETLQTLRWIGLSVFDLLVTIAERKNNPDFEQLVASFIEQTEAELWEDRIALETFASSTDNMSRFISGELGSNLIFKFKALSLTKYFGAICDVLVENIHVYLQNKPIDSCSEIFELLRETVEFKRLQVEGIFGDDDQRQGYFSFPVDTLNDYLSDNSPTNIYPKLKRQLFFRHTDSQRDSINSYKRVFGDDIPGLTRILTRARVTEFYRLPEKCTSVDI